ncbi:MAG: ATP-binding cassette domain-containing protein [Chlamydiales bacterium]|nr:ATP-binding cassette domain-containing protein [Chlamydiales bacterium]
MIYFNNVSFNYFQEPALSNVSFTINQNEFIGIIGPNGGGKTTLLNLLLGFLTPTNGSISIHKQPASLARKTIGYVPQKRFFDLSFPISVMEVVLMGALSHLNHMGRYPAIIKEKAKYLLDQFELDTLKDHPFGQLSGGQMQKTLIARALISDPTILVLDEPTASVDPHAEENLYQLLLTLKHKKTIFIVTHEVPGILPQVDRVLYVNKQAHFIPKQNVCSHVAMGLYHEPERNNR